MQSGTEQQETAGRTFIEEGEIRLPRGPWDAEPNSIRWRCAGLQCWMEREEAWGHWTGFVELPEGHPLRSVPLEALPPDVRGAAHGGVTYRGPGPDGEGSWLGFHCAHALDEFPALLAHYSEARREMDMERYRTAPYVRDCVEQLARAVARSAVHR